MKKLLVLFLALSAVAGASFAQETTSPWSFEGGFKSWVESRWGWEKGATDQGSIEDVWSSRKRDPLVEGDVKSLYTAQKEGIWNKGSVTTPINLNAFLKVWYTQKIWKTSLDFRVDQDKNFKATFYTKWELPGLGGFEAENLGIGSVSSTYKEVTKVKDDGTVETTDKTINGGIGFLYNDFHMKLWLKPLDEQVDVQYFYGYDAGSLYNMAAMGDGNVAWNWYLDSDGVSKSSVSVGGMNGNWNGSYNGNFRFYVKPNETSPLNGLLFGTSLNLPRLGESDLDRKLTADQVIGKGQYFLRYNMYPVDFTLTYWARPSFERQQILKERIDVDGNAVIDPATQQPRTLAGDLEASRLALGLVANLPLGIKLYELAELKSWLWEDEKWWKDVITHSVDIWSTDNPYYVKNNLGLEMATPFGMTLYLHHLFQANAYERKPLTEYWVVNDFEWEGKTYKVEKKVNVNDTGEDPLELPMFFNQYEIAATYTIPVANVWVRPHVQIEDNDTTKLAATLDASKTLLENFIPGLNVSFLKAELNIDERLWLNEDEGKFVNNKGSYLKFSPRLFSFAQIIPEWVGIGAKIGWLSEIPQSDIARETHAIGIQAQTTINLKKGANGLTDNGFGFDTGDDIWNNTLHFNFIYTYDFTLQTVGNTRFLVALRTTF